MSPPLALMPFAVRRIPAGPHMPMIGVVDSGAYPIVFIFESEPEIYDVLFPLDVYDWSPK